MSLWKGIACSPEIEQRMKLYYDQKGLTDIRILYAQWIEDRILSQRINNNTNSSDVYEIIALRFYEDLKQKIINSSNDSLMKYKLAEICNKVTQIPALDLYNHLSTGLQREIQLLENMPQNTYIPNLAVMGGIENGILFGGSGGGSSGVGVGVGVGGLGLGMDMQTNNEHNETQYQRFQTLSNDIGRLQQNYTALYKDYEVLTKSYNEYNQNKQHLTHDQLNEASTKLTTTTAIVINQKQILIEEVRRIVAVYNEMQIFVFQELKNWRRNQALAGNGAPFNANLDEIQRGVEFLVDAVCKILDQINLLTLVKLNNDTTSESGLMNLHTHVRYLQELLVLSAFIVEKQPPQVMKTQTRFAAAVRWLIGPKLDIYTRNPTVECIILSEAQAQRHSTQRTDAGSTSSGIPLASGEIINNVGTMEYQQNSGVFSVSFRNMQLKKIKRAEKKGTESVMDEKFALLFCTSSVVNEYRIRVWTLSLPVVVIVHGNQEPQSWATITWDNAFADIEREPFKVREQVPWQQLSYALNTKFASATGRPLTEENLHFIYEKLFRRDVREGDYKDFISWAQFCKEPLQDRTFTFWDWFFAIMKLTKDHLLGLWKAGLIVGFIDKNRIHQILPNELNGTFLLRFSDSELGGISVAFLNNGVHMLQPWTAKDLAIRGLADRVHDLEILQFLYRGTPRDQAFRDFYTTTIDPPATRDGYVGSTIRAHVPAIEGSVSSTPIHVIQSPHPQDVTINTDNNYMMNFNYNEDMVWVSDLNNDLSNENNFI